MHNKLLTRQIQPTPPLAQRHASLNSQNHSTELSARVAASRMCNGILRAGTTICGDLVLPKNAYAILPRKTHIRGSVMMIWCSGVKLGDGLTIDGNADFSLSDIERFPRRLTVKGDLFLIGTTGFERFPPDMKVEGLIHLDDSATQSMLDRAATAMLEYKAKHPRHQGQRS